MLKVIYKRFFTTRSKCQKKEFWYLILFNLFFIISSRLLVESEDTTLVFLAFLLAIPTTWLFITTVLRRLKDIGKSWDNIIFLFIPLVGLIALVWIGTKDSVEDKTNKTIKKD